MTAVKFTCEIELELGESLQLPPAVAESVGPGHWVITVERVEPRPRLRDHSAFLSSYAPQDDGLYDDYPTR